MVPIILAILTAILPLQDKLEGQSPWSGRISTYENANGKSVKIHVSRHGWHWIEFQGKSLRVQPTTWMGRKAFLLEKPGETWILGEGVVGKNGGKGNVLWYVFRWTGDDKWSFHRVNGCISMKISCTREAVGGGKYMRFRMGKETWSISRKNGVLNCTRPDGTWTGAGTAQCY